MPFTMSCGHLLEEEGSGTGDYIEDGGERQVINANKTHLRFAPVSDMGDKKKVKNVWHLYVLYVH
jgi:hypothetical protein